MALTMWLFILTSRSSDMLEDRIDWVRSDHGASSDIISGGRWYTYSYISLYQQFSGFCIQPCISFFFFYKVCGLTVPYKRSLQLSNVYRLFWQENFNAVLGDLESCFRNKIPSFQIFVLYPWRLAKETSLFQIL